tara:strand:+ start:1357 stop:1716 length:360 start_codon:yes stop_codon:yes gene_type:complete
MSRKKKKPEPEIDGVPMKEIIMAAHGVMREAANAMTRGQATGPVSPLRGLRPTTRKDGLSAAYSFDWPGDGADVDKARLAQQVLQEARILEDPIVTIRPGRKEFAFNVSIHWTAQEEEG